MKAAMRTRLPRGCAIAAVTALVLLTPATALAADGVQHAPASASSQRSCPAPADGTAIPSAPPPGVAWRHLGAMPVPVSPAAGPARRTGAAWRCYAHSPAGAVLAAFGIPAALCGPHWRAATALEVLPGPGRRAFLAAGALQRFTPPAGTITRPVGFAVVSYRWAQATVETLVADGSEFAASFRTLAWSHGDWRLVMLPDGTTGPGPQIITTASGFTLWGGGNA
jgi:hypothetical protein